MPELILADAFPATTGFVIGGDNTVKPVTEGEYCKFSLGTGEGRDELSVNNGTSAQKWEEGESFYNSWKETVTAPYGYGGSGKHGTIWQLKGIEDFPAGGGKPSPYVALELSNYGGNGNGLYLIKEAATETKILSAAALENIEIHVQMWCLVSKSKAGKLLIKVNGTTVYEVSGWNTLEADSTWAFIKTGIYAGSASASRTRKIREFVLWRSPEWAVDPEGEEEEGPVTGPPKEVETVAASSITRTSARLKGKANPNGIATVMWMRYGLTEDLSTAGAYSVTEDVGIGEDDIQTSIEQIVESLPPGTKVWFKAGAEQPSVGSSTKTFGSVLNFTTLKGVGPVIVAPGRAQRGLRMRR